MGGPVSGVIAASVVAMTIAAGPSGQARPEATPEARPLASTFRDISRIELSPDGRVLVLTGTAAESGTPLVALADTACLARRQRIAPCIKQQIPRPVLVQGWAASSDAVLIGLGKPRLFFRQGRGWASGPPLDGPTVGTARVLPKDVLGKEISLARPPSQMAPWLKPTDPAVADIGLDYRTVLSPAGELIAWSAPDLPLTIFGSGGKAVTLPDDIALAQIDYLPFYELTPRADGRGFYVWSSSMGAGGILMRYLDGVRSDYALPARPGGPLSFAVPPSAHTVLAAYTADRVFAADTAVSARAERLDRYVRRVRARESHFQLRQIAPSDDLRRAVLLFVSADGRWTLRSVDLGNGAVTRLAAGGRRSGVTIRSAYTPVPTDFGQLPARLYSVDGRRSRGTVVTFHGGPGVDTRFNSHAGTRRLVALDFDVLDVDYRGSTGYGYDHYRALRAPDLMSVLLRDLTAGVAFARQSRPEAAGLVGFQGTSAGGLAGVAAAGEDVPGLDFILLDSALIDVAERIRIAKCDPMQWGARFLGATPRAEGGCELGRTGAFALTRFGRTPILSYSGGFDRKTPSSMAASWVQFARQGGACILTLDVPDGRHTLDSLPPERADAAVARISDWIDAVAAGRRDGLCA